MNPYRQLTRWLDIRPAEARNVLVSFVGAFLVLAFLTLGRALREALYLTAFDIDALPYITAAVALLSLPTVSGFTLLLGRYRPRRVVIVCAGGMAVLLGGLWPFVLSSPAVTVIFYLVTALGTLVLTSGFWVVVSERFLVRRAKRHYGLISAGGTAGALLMGASLVWLTDLFDLFWLIPLLVILVLLFAVALLSLARQPSGHSESGGISDPASTGQRESTAEAKTSARLTIRRNLSLIFRTPHLRSIAAIVFFATAASTLVDFQFKELARASYDNQADLTGFLGAFYGWAGGVALVIQFLVVGRFMAATGLVTGLAVLPVALLLGSSSIVFAPGLILLTVVRGADFSLRKSLFRPLVELLYVPLPSALRRKTKTFIDSVVDSLGEGFGAVVIFFWVTLGGMPSRFLALLVMAVALILLGLNRLMGRRYLDTITNRLQEEAAEERPDSYSPHARDLLSATFTRVNLQPLLVEAAGETPDPGSAGGTTGAAEITGDSTDEEILTRLRSPSIRVVVQALTEFSDWRAEHIPSLVRLLARDQLYGKMVEILCDFAELSLPVLVTTLADEDADFVIRRRLPAVLARVGGPGADDTLLESLTARRFEIRYRAAIALVRRRREQLPESARDWSARIWHAIRLEVTRDRPLWELQKLLDNFDRPDDDLVQERVGVRGELSLEHTFRMLTLVLDPEPVRAAFQGIILDDEKLKSFALEYLEHVLPATIRQRLWLFIGDVSEYHQQRELRTLNHVVSDLVNTRATLFAGDMTREALQKMLEESERSTEDQE
ncbi:MAG: Npt1/Npt2 family nucleotide transporter [bacterium]